MVDQKRPENLLFTYQGPKEPVPAISTANTTSWEDSDAEHEGDQVDEDEVQAAESLQQELVAAETDASTGTDAAVEGAPLPELGLQVRQADWAEAMHGTGQRLEHSGQRHWPARASESQP